MLLAGDPGGHAARPAAAVPHADVLDDDAAVHVREAEVLQPAALRLAAAARVAVEGDGAAVGGLPHAGLVLLVGVAHQGGALVRLLEN